MHQLVEHPTEDVFLDFIRKVLKENPNMFADHKSDAGCFMRAFRLGEPTFTLRAQDQTSAETVGEWLLKNPQLSNERKNETLRKSAWMRSWPTKKAAD